MTALRPRLKTEIRVGAHLRRAVAGGAFATVARKGDPDAGAIAVKVYLGGGAALLFLEGYDETGAEVWAQPLGGPTPEHDVDARLEKERRFDTDMWILEIEDREGRAFLPD